jgi:hypothetical protein
MKREKCDLRMDLMVTPKVRKMLEKLAHDEGFTMSQWLRRAVLLAYTAKYEASK